MTTWTNDELDRIGDAEELRIAALRPDGTLRDPVTIWVVRHDNELYVRSYKGAGAGWYRGTQASHQGHVQAGGVDKDVAFVDVDGLDEPIDDAYRAKYRSFGASYVDAMVAPGARATTLKLVPRP
ncbi:MAG TPA: DUF2255 family protein [Trebonia sp.]|jgi:hypothetical protein|nr:DUF2255 family protein [Trebonia sp.]